MHWFAFFSGMNKENQKTEKFNININSPKLLAKRLLLSLFLLSLSLLNFIECNMKDVLSSPLLH